MAVVWYIAILIVLQMMMCCKKLLSVYCHALKKSLEKSVFLALTKMSNFSPVGTSWWYCVGASRHNCVRPSVRSSTVSTGSTHRHMTPTARFHSRSTSKTTVSSFFYFCCDRRTISIFAMELGLRNRPGFSALFVTQPTPIPAFDDPRLDDHPKRRARIRVKMASSNTAVATDPIGSS